MSDGAVQKTTSDRLLGLLGLALKAGRLGLGYSAAEKMVHRGENPLVIVALDMGDSQKAKVGRWEPVRGIVDDIVKADDLARALGRDKLSVVAVSDAGFVKGIRKLQND